MGNYKLTLTLQCLSLSGHECKSRCQHDLNSFPWTTGGDRQRDRFYFIWQPKPGLAFRSESAEFSAPPNTIQVISEVGTTGGEHCDVVTSAEITGKRHILGMAEAVLSCKCWKRPQTLRTQLTNTCDWSNQTKFQQFGYNNQSFYHTQNTAHFSDLSCAIFCCASAVFAPMFSMISGYNPISSPKLYTLPLPRYTVDWHLLPVYKDNSFTACKVKLLAVITEFWKLKPLCLQRQSCPLQWQPAQ